MNTIGHRASEQALQLGLLFRPAEALQVGLVDQVVPEDQVLSTALSVMARWMAIPGEGHGGGGATAVGTGGQVEPRPLPSLELLVRQEVLKQFTNEPFTIAD